MWGTTKLRTNPLPPPNHNGGDPPPARPALLAPPRRTPQRGRRSSYRRGRCSCRGRADDRCRRGRRSPPPPDEPPSPRRPPSSSIKAIRKARPRLLLPLPLLPSLHRRGFSSGNDSAVDWATGCAHADARRLPLLSRSAVAMPFGDELQTRSLSRRNAAAMASTPASAPYGLLLMGWGRFLPPTSPRSTRRCSGTGGRVLNFCWSELLVSEGTGKAAANNRLVRGIGGRPMAAQWTTVTAARVQKWREGRLRLRHRRLLRVVLHPKGTVQLGAL